MGDCNTLALDVDELVFYPMLMLLLKSPAKGCQSAVYCATSQDLLGVTGKHIVNSKIRNNPLPKSLDRKAARKLNDISKDLTNLSYEIILNAIPWYLNDLATL